MVKLALKENFNYNSKVGGGGGGGSLQLSLWNFNVCIGKADAKY